MQASGYGLKSCRSVSVHCFELSAMTPVVCRLTLGSSCESRTIRPFPFVQPGWKRVHANAPRRNRHSNWNADILLPSRKSEAIRFRTMQGWQGKNLGATACNVCKVWNSCCCQKTGPCARRILPIASTFGIFPPLPGSILEETF